MILGKRFLKQVLKKDAVTTGISISVSSQKASTMGGFTSNPVPGT
jgi:hypothetical protein